MKKILLSAILILFVSSVASFNASLDTAKQTANSTSPAQYKLQIHNPSPQKHTYSISVLAPKHSWFYYANTVKVSSKSNKTINMTVNPVEKALKQKYGFTGKVREQETGEIKEFSGFFQTKQPYKIHIMSLTQDESSVKPGQVVNTEIEIQNLDNSPVSTYQVKAQYKNQTRTDTGTEILPGGTRRYNFKFKTSKNAQPTTKPIKYTVTANEKLQNTAQQTITIQSTKNIIKTEKTENKILKISKTFTAKNTGNSPTNTSLTAQIPSYLTSITSTTPETNKIEEVDGNTVYTWEKTLKPGEEYSTTYNTKYWIPLAGTLLLTAGIITIKLLGKNIELRKTTQKEGNRIKINLEIENTGEKTYDKIELQEFIPDIATVDEKFSMNTPKIRKTSEGTKLTWNIENLEPGDQRIIQYTIKPKVEVEEQVEFQKAVLRDMEGEKMAESNTTTSEFNTT